jgi:hypothetical protein
VHDSFFQKKKGFTNERVDCSQHQNKLGSIFSEHMLIENFKQDKVGIALGRSNETLMVIQIHNPSQSIMQK